MQDEIESNSKIHTSKYKWPQVPVSKKRANLKILKTSEPVDISNVGVDDSSFVTPQNKSLVVSSSKSSITESQESDLKFEEEEQEAEQEKKHKKLTKVARSLFPPVKLVPKYERLYYIEQNSPSVEFYFEKTMVKSRKAQTQDVTLSEIYRNWSQDSDSMINDITMDLENTCIVTIPFKKDNRYEALLVVDLERAKEVFSATITTDGVLEIVEKSLKRFGFSKSDFSVHYGISVRDSQDKDIMLENSNKNEIASPAKEPSINSSSDSYGTKLVLWLLSQAGDGLGSIFDAFDCNTVSNLMSKQMNRIYWSHLKPLHDAVGEDLWDACLKEMITPVQNSSNILDKTYCSICHSGKKLTNAQAFILGGESELIYASPHCAKKLVALSRFMGTLLDIVRITKQQPQTDHRETVNLKTVMDVSEVDLSKLPKSVRQLPDFNRNGVLKLTKLSALLDLYLDEIMRINTTSVTDIE